MFEGIFNNNLISISDDQSRIEMRNDLLVHSYSSFFDGFFEGVGQFTGVCLSNPIELQPRKTVLSSTQIYYPIKIRPLDIHGFILPKVLYME